MKRIQGYPLADESVTQFDWCSYDKRKGTPEGAFGVQRTGLLGDGSQGDGAVMFFHLVLGLLGLQFIEVGQSLHSFGGDDQSTLGVDIGQVDLGSNLVVHKRKGLAAGDKLGHRLDVDLFSQRLGAAEGFAQVADIDLGLGKGLIEHLGCQVLSSLDQFRLGHRAAQRAVAIAILLRFTHDLPPSEESFVPAGGEGDNHLDPAVDSNLSKRGKIAGQIEKNNLAERIWSNDS